MDNADHKPAETKKKPKPNLKLNTNQKTFNDNEILVLQNSNNCYVIQNHPYVTDLTESASGNKYRFGKFFQGANTTEPFKDFSSMGEYFYVIQKSNGKEMQDRYKARHDTGHKNLSFFGVYDGHSTQLIAQLLTDKLDEYFLEDYIKHFDMVHAIKTAFFRIEKEVISELQEFKPRGGSTALALVMHHEHVYCANLGDARAILFKENKYQELTTLHDFTNENERLYAEKHGGTVLNNRLEGELAVSRSIGDINFKKYMNSDPEILSAKLTEDDEVLILGTDGFWNGLGPEGCLKFIQKINLKKANLKDLKLLGDALIEEAMKNVKTKKDNVTLIVISIKGYIEKHGFKSDIVK